MGDPKHQRKKFTTPMHPWQRERLELEAKLVQEYGIRTKQEIYKMDSLRKRFTRKAKSLIADQSPQAQKEKGLMLAKLYRMGLIESTGVDIDRVLSLTLKDIMERRLQTQVFRKGLARSVGQARQMIVHGHISVGNKKITSPSHITTRDEEATIRYSADSSFTSPDHPEITKPARSKPAAEPAPKLSQEASQ